MNGLLATDSKSLPFGNLQNMIMPLTLLKIASAISQPTPYPTSFMNRLSTGLYDALTTGLLMTEKMKQQQLMDALTQQKLKEEQFKQSLLGSLFSSDTEVLTPEHPAWHPPMLPQYPVKRGQNVFEKLFGQDLAPLITYQFATGKNITPFLKEYVTKSEEQKKIEEAGQIVNEINKAMQVRTAIEGDRLPVTETGLIALRHQLGVEPDQFQDYLDAYKKLDKNLAKLAKINPAEHTRITNYYRLGEQKTPYKLWQRVVTWEDGKKVLYEVTGFDQKTGQPIWRKISDIPETKQGGVTEKPYTVQQRIDDLKQEFNAAINALENEYMPRDPLLALNPEKLAEYNERLKQLIDAYNEEYKRITGKESPVVSRMLKKKHIRDVTPAVNYLLGAKNENDARLRLEKLKKAGWTGEEIEEIRRRVIGR